MTTGSRYIYDLYYEKNAISKQLYEWLLKNNYADANLIAKWKKQGYEKVLLQPPPPPLPFFRPLWVFVANVAGFSYAVSAAYNRKKRISTQLVFVVYRRHNLKRISRFSVLVVDVGDVLVVID